MTVLDKALNYTGDHGIAVAKGILPLIKGERKQSAMAAGTTPTITWGETNPPTSSEPDGSVYFVRNATATEDVLWHRESSAWVKLLVLSDLLLPAASDVTVAAGGAATLTGSVHTVRGSGGLADNCDTVSGMTATEIAFLLTGAEAITYRDASVGGGNISISGDTSIVTATGDLVMAVLSGTVVRIVPLVVQAGMPVETNALARGFVVGGDSNGHMAAVDLGAANGLLGSDGTDAKRMTISAHAQITTSGPSADDTASATTGATVGNSTDVTGVTAAGAATGADGTGATSSSGTETIGRLLPFAVLGAWAVDGDGARTHGGGLVGDTPTLTNAAAAMAVVYDHGTTTYALLSESNTTMPAIYTANYQVFPDAETAEDAVYFGAAVPFCELALDLSATVGVYANDSCVWEYWTGAAWAAIPTLYDNTDTTAQDGLRPFQQDGALVFVPPTDWASTTVNGQAAYWVRSRVTAEQITTAALTNAVEHDIVTGTEGWRPPHAGDLTAIVVNDNAAVLHTTADVIFVLIDSVSGGSRSFTFSQDRRRQRITCTSWALTTAARISAFVAQEDGAAEPTGVVLELEYSLATSDHTHTGPSHTHTAGAITVTDAGHTHTATVTDVGHTHGPGSHTHTGTPDAHTLA